MAKRRFAVDFELLYGGDAEEPPSFDRDMQDYLLYALLRAVEDYDVQVFTLRADLSRAIDEWLFNATKRFMRRCGDPDERQAAHKLLSLIHITEGGPQRADVVLTPKGWYRTSDPDRDICTAFDCTPAPA